MKDIDFDLWLKNKCHWKKWDRAKTIYTALSPFEEYMPNLKDFIVWLLDDDTGYFPNWFPDGADDDFIKAISEKTEKYSDTEKGITALIIKHLFADIGLKVTDGHNESRRKIYYSVWSFYAMKFQEYNLPFEVIQQPFDKDMPGIGFKIERTKTPIPVNPGFIANESALAYIFDLYADGKQIPTNRIEGGLNKKHLMKIGESRGYKGDTFYRAVKTVCNYDLNKKDELESISVRWLEVCTELSSNKEKLTKYLKDKMLA